MNRRGFLGGVIGAVLAKYVGGGTPMPDPVDPNYRLLLHGDDSTIQIPPYLWTSMGGPAVFYLDERTFKVAMYDSRYAP